MSFSVRVYTVQCTPGLWVCSQAVVKLLKLETRGARLPQLSSRWYSGPRMAFCIEPAGVAPDWSKSSQDKETDPWKGVRLLRRPDRWIACLQFCSCQHVRVALLAMGSQIGMHAGVYAYMLRSSGFAASGAHVQGARTCQLLEGRYQYHSHRGHARTRCRPRGSRSRVVG